MPFHVQVFGKYNYVNSANTELYSHFTISIQYTQSISPISSTYLDHPPSQNLVSASRINMITLIKCLEPCTNRIIFLAPSAYNQNITLWQAGRTTQMFNLFICPGLHECSCDVNSGYFPVLHCGYLGGPGVIFVAVFPITTLTHQLPCAFLCNFCYQILL